MRLNPVSAQTLAPSYPRRSWQRATWLRRALGVAIATVALGVIACGGEGPLRDEDLTTDNIELAGAQPEPNFWCSEEEPEWLQVLSAPGTHEGDLCGELTGWAAVDVIETGLYRLSLSSGADHADIAILDPQGDQVAQLDEGTPALIVELTRGRWLLAATAADPVNAGWSSFQLLIERL